MTDGATFKDIQADFIHVHQILVERLIKITFAIPDHHCRVTSRPPSGETKDKYKDISVTFQWEEEFCHSIPAIALLGTKPF